MKALITPLLLAVATAGALAQSTAPATPDEHASHHAAPAAETALSEGEVLRIDPRVPRITLRHGEIQNLDMPPMTMAFRVREAQMLAPFKAGDKVRFRVEQINGGYVVTRLEAAR